MPRPKTFKKISLGKIKPAISKEKAIKLNSNEIIVNKVNGKTQYYTKHYGVDRAQTLHLSLYGRKVLKEHPEILNFLKKNIFSFSPKDLYTSYNVYNFENKELHIKLHRDRAVRNGKNKIIFKMDIQYKLHKKKNDKNGHYFIKVCGPESFNADREFVANQLFQKFGINTIKPHFSYKDSVLKRSIIVYEFSSLETLNNALKNKKISSKKYKSILDKVTKLKEYIKENKSLDPLTKEVGGFIDPKNMYISKNGIKINVYFTDLFY